MPRISEILAEAQRTGTWDHQAQIAAVWADMAPALHSACLEAAFAIARAKTDWRGLQRAWALCDQVAEAVYKATGLTGRGTPAMSWAGLGAPQRQAILAATERAFREIPLAPDDGVADYTTGVAGRA